MDAATLVLALFCFVSGTGLQAPPVTVHLDLAGERHAYTMQAPGRDGVLYCKDTLVDDLFSTTGWLVVPDAGLYGRLVEFCFTNPIPQ